MYVLEPPLPAQHSHNKWIDRSRVGIFICHSPSHSTRVLLILNTKTANVTPQFHCLYDDAFATCKTDAKFSSVWQIKANLKVVPLSIHDLIDKGIPLPQPTPISIETPNLPLAFIDPWDTESTSTSPEEIDFFISDADIPPPLPEPPTVTFAEPAPPSPPPVEPTITRSGRTIRKPSRFSMYALAVLFAHTATSSPTTSPSTFLF